MPDDRRRASEAPPEPPGRDLLRDRTVVVTAAAGTGIGSAVARRALLEGADVLLSDRSEPRLEQTATRLEEEFGRRPHTIVCDVTDQQQVDQLFDGAEEKLGTIDVLVNNAGLGGVATVAEMTDEQWHRVLDVTLTGTFRCTRAALQRMYLRRTGVIVNNASVLGWRAQAGQAHYAAAKAGVMALTRSSAVEAAEFGVRVNAVAPSLAMHDNLARASSEDLLRDLEAREAFGRAAEPFEVANTMIFLASDLSSYLTGEVISVSSQHP